MQQYRIARDWDDVPAAIREDVRRQAEGDVRRVELVDRPEDGYSVIVHDLPLRPDRVATAKAFGDDDPQLREVIERTLPMPLSRS